MIGTPLSSIGGGEFYNALVSLLNGKQLSIVFFQGQDPISRAYSKFRNVV